MTDNLNNPIKRPRPNKIPVKQRKKIQFLNRIPLPTSNRFSALSNSDDAMHVDEIQQTKKPIITPIIVLDHESDIQTVLTELKIVCNFKLNSVGRKNFVICHRRQCQTNRKIQKEKNQFLFPSGKKF